MSIKVLDTLEGAYIVPKGLGLGRLVDHAVFEEPAVKAWEKAKADREAASRECVIMKPGPKWGW